MASARTRANRKYNEKAYDRLSITVPKGVKSLIQAAASEVGQSINEYTAEALRARMGLTEWGKKNDF